MSNLNYLFNYEYYAKLGKSSIGDIDKEFKNCNKKLIGAKLISDSNSFICLDGFYSFKLKTQYPGLLIGIGNPHEAGSNKSANKEAETYKNQIGLGFSLDYVTGMPVIHGSTVKGVLRSPFTNYPEYIKGLFAEIDGKLSQLSDQSIKKITEELFEKNNVFLDAYPVKTTEGRLLGLDNITPHNQNADHGYEGLTAPIPLIMLKVYPGVLFEFRFKLFNMTVHVSQSEKSNSFEQITICADNIANKLFRRIIEDLGIGAKTNVGYGVMIPDVRICKECGKPTKFNNETGEYYEYCQEHAPKVYSTASASKATSIAPPINEQGKPDFKKVRRAILNPHKKRTDEEKKLLQEAIEWYDNATKNNSLPPNEDWKTVIKEAKKLIK